jgi:hypothetical protein
MSKPRKFTRACGSVLIVFLSVLMAGCKTGVEKDIDALDEPVYIAAMSDNGLILRGASGNVVQVNEEYCIYKSISGSGLKTGDIFIPAIETVGR